MTQKKKQPGDLRVRRTRKMLMQALIELTIEKGFSAITVQDIAERAMVNRATFYRHYLDKYDLLDQYMNEIYEMTAAQEKRSSGKLPGTASEDPPVGMVKMFEHVQMNADFYRAMLGAKGDLAFMQRIQQYSETRLRNLLTGRSTKPKSKGLPLDLCLSYLSHAGVGALVWWLRSGQSYAPEQFAGWLNQLNTGVLALLKQRGSNLSSSPGMG
jgi:AcrR family transcriptional regulator